MDADIQAAAVRVVRGGDAAQSAAPPGARPGPRRLVDAPGVTIALARTPPGGGTPWHHHGARDTYVYVLEGAVQVESGPGGQERVEAAAGDLLVVPPGVVHRERNAGAAESAALIVWAGTGEPMVSTDGPDTR